jgi:hypothetical protein
MIYGNGILAGAGTGMTKIGMALQVLMVVVSGCVIGILAWPALPLTTEWPAQWIGLVSDLDRAVPEDAVHGTSAGAIVLLAIYHFTSLGVKEMGRGFLG